MTVRLGEVRSRLGNLAAAIDSLATEKARVSALIVLSIGMALSEGVSVTLLIPALDSSSIQSVFGNIPVLRNVGRWLGSLAPGERIYVVTGLLAIAVTLRGIMQFGSQYLAVLIPLRLNCALAMRGYEALVEADMAYMSGRDQSELQSMLREHPQRAAAVVNGLLTYVISIILIAIFTSLMLLASQSAPAASVPTMSLSSAHSSFDAGASGAQWSSGGAALQS